MDDINFKELQLQTDNEELSFEDVDAGIDHFDHDSGLDVAQFMETVLHAPGDQRMPQTNGSIIAEHELTLNLCEHEECNKINLTEIAKGFHSLSMNERISTVRAMLFPLSSEEENDLFMFTGTAKRKKLKMGDEVEPGRNTVYYAFKGKRVCRQSFAGVVGLYQETVRRHAYDVSQNSTFIKYHNDTNKRRSGIWGIQRVAVKVYLITLANDYGMECPTGRGSKDESPVRILPSHFTKVKVYVKYKECWDVIVTELVSMVNKFTRPDQPLSYNLFTRYWGLDFGLLKIACKGSDFCHKCTKLSEILKSRNSNDVAYIAAKNERAKHMNEAKAEFQNYKADMQNTTSGNSTTVRHFVFDFAEKVLLPKLQKQPGQLHFTTGLKFDLFGVHYSNRSTTNSFGLVEGYWPNEKTANVVISMLHDRITAALSSEEDEEHNTLKFHADNCAGQNKNQFVLFYLLWRAANSFEQEIYLSFLVAGHTKNVCDGDFGHVKRKLLKSDVITPSQMMDVIRESSLSTNCIPGSTVYWRNWKDFLSRYFKVPSKFKINSYHVFRVNSREKGILFAKELSTSTKEFRFDFNKAGAPKIDTCEMNDSCWRASWRRLSEVYSKQHDTREGYLLHKVIDAYYPDNEDIRSAFFASGE